MTLLGIDRPGYGDSDPIDAAHWADVPTAAADISDVLDILGIREVGVAGWGAGGRVALALACRRPDLVDRVVVIGTPAPDLEIGWQPDSVRLLLDELSGADSGTAQARLQQHLADRVPGDPRAGDALDLLSISPADDAVVGDADTAQRLGDMLAYAFMQGSIGWIADIAGYALRPWGFEPAEVGAKTLLLYGAKDPVAAGRHASWWQRRLPDSRVEMSPTAGHLQAGLRWPRALSHLAPHSKRASS